VHQAVDEHVALTAAAAAPSRWISGAACRCATVMGPLHCRDIMPRDPDIERRRVFARNLRIARQRAHLTQVDMAEAMEMSETVYAR
jgi:hypothetical protein